ncbi:MAG: hypothetical protein Q9186_000057 [Xanthomendoza sp. 1 TL-2023]
MSDAQYEPPACSSWDPTNPPTYGYIPSLAAGVVFTLLFGIAFTAHLAQTIISRRWWLFLFTTGAAGELLGWIARTWASQCAYSSTAFQIQISTLIFSPAFFAAGIYVILGYIIHIFGSHTSPLSAKQYLWVFCSIDFFSLLLQAVGGGLASAAGEKPNGDLKPGTNTMIVGIIFQLAANLVFAGLAASVVAKTYKKGKGILNVDDLAISQSDATKTRAATTTRRMRILVGATSISTLALIVRGIYRSIELLQGWRGYLITTESYFIGLDGALMAIAVLIFVIANPGWLLPHKGECTGTSLESGNGNVEKAVDGSESM